jgi:hypothetical protein
MVLMKGVTMKQVAALPPVQVPGTVQGLLPAARLNHAVVEGVVVPDDEEEQGGVGLYEPGPPWLEQAFDNGYDLVSEAEDAIDCLLKNYAKKLPPHQHRKLATLHADLMEYLRFYEGES